MIFYSALKLSNKWLTFEVILSTILVSSEKNTFSIKHSYSVFLSNPNYFICDFQLLSDFLPLSINFTVGFRSEDLGRLERSRQGIKGLEFDASSSDRLYLLVSRLWVLTKWSDNLFSLSWMSCKFFFLLVSVPFPALSLLSFSTLFLFDEKVGCIL